MFKKIISITLLILLQGCAGFGFVTDINGVKKGSYSIESCIEDKPINRLMLQRDANAFNPKCDDGFEFCEGKLEEKNGDICVVGKCTAPKCEG